MLSRVPSTRPHSSLRIAFGGRMQVGKTTAADHLVGRHGFQKYALADPIKRIASEAFGWDGRKDDRGRRLLQEIGSVGRHYAPDIWLERFAARLAADSPHRAVVDDLRLAREVEFLRRLGFVCVRVDRPGHLIAPAVHGHERQGHETETGLEALELDASVPNRSSFEALYERLDALVVGLESGADGGARGGTEKPRPGGGAFGVGQEETRA